MVRAVLAACLCAAAVYAAPVPPENDVARMVRIFGTKSDPGENARFEMVGDKLRIMLPAHEAFSKLTPRVRAQLRNDYFLPDGAPRVWQELDGDFTVTVRVGFPASKANGPTVSFGSVAGLVIWADISDHYGLVRYRGPSARSGEFVKLSYVQPGSVCAGGSSLDMEADASLFLRLTREDQSVTSSYSTDGKKWDAFTPDRVDWKTPVKVGVYIKNLSDTPFEATFDQYSLTLPKK
jgi:hypothetical protein